MTNSTMLTPLLDGISDPSDLRGLPEGDLRQLADELRQATVDAVSKTGGHLGAGLGVVELTAAIHYVFDTPRDILIWDVGHQCYPHKILTGRRDRIHTLRQGGGLSGFTKRSESEYDPFGAAHSSTSISSGLGFAVGRDLKGEKDRNVIAVIGKPGFPEDVDVVARVRGPHDVRGHAVGDQGGGHAPRPHMCAAQLVPPHTVARYRENIHERPYLPRSYHVRGGRVGANNANGHFGPRMRFPYSMYNQSMADKAGRHTQRPRMRSGSPSGPTATFRPARLSR